MNLKPITFQHRLFSLISGILLACLAVMSAAAQSATDTQAAQDFSRMLSAIDARISFKDSDFSARVRMVSEEPQKAIDTKTVQMMRRDKDDKFLMLILQPENQLGQGYLRVEDNLWFYDPESRKFTHSSMKENFQGTNAKNSDFGTSTLARDYLVSTSNSGKLGNYEVWILELAATNNEVSYPFKKLWVTKKDGLLLKSEDYSLTKRLLRTAYYASYAKLGENFVADKSIFVDALVAGKKTTLSLSDISLKAIPDSVFSKAYVEKVNH